MFDEWISKDTQSVSYDVGSNSASDDDDDLWKITTTGDSSQKIKTTSISDGSGGNVSIGGNMSSQSIKIGPNEESIQKFKKLAREQLEKLGRLRDLIIDYLSENEVNREDKIQWKSDLDKIEEFKRRLKNGLSAENSTSMFLGGDLIGKEEVLEPSELDELNEIYRRWKSATPE